MNSPYWSWSTQPQQPICVSGSPITAPSLACTSPSHLIGSASDGVGSPSAARTGMNASAPVLRIVQPISPWIMQSGGSFAACVLLISTAMSSGLAEKRLRCAEAQVPIFGGGSGVRKSGGARRVPGRLDSATGASLACPHSVRELEARYSSQPRRSPRSNACRRSLDDGASAQPQFYLTLAS